MISDVINYKFLLCKDKKYMQQNKTKKIKKAQAHIFNSGNMTCYEQLSHF